MSRLVRFDDQSVRPARSRQLDTELGRGSAVAPCEVEAAIADAEAQALGGRWVVLAVDYEAAVAFDPVMRTPPLRRNRPIVRWASFARSVAPATLPPPGPVAAGISRREATGHFVGAVQQIRARIAAGDVYQVNLTDRYRARTTDPLALYAGLLASQSCAYGAFVEFDDVTYACASPELFFRWDGSTISTRPMKGTRARHPRADTDAQRARDLARSAKDRAENVMIVDLLRNDLARLAEIGTVQVPELCTIERYETVWQMTSTITATVAPTTTLVDVFRALFPCGSITGAPKVAAMDLIADLEGAPRGIYCGALGVLAPPGEGPRAVFCVPIRTATIGPSGRLTYGAGAGITWPSDPDEEDAEVAAKARVLTHPWPAFELLETLRLDGDGVRNPDLHLDRLSASAEWFGIPFALEAAEALLASLSPTAEPHRVRLLLARDGELRVEAAPLDRGTEHVRLAIDTHVTPSDDVFACHKTTARDHYRRALERHPGADDVVLVNERGAATDTTTGNLAYRLGDRWWTPPLDDGGLAGIGRRTAIDAGRLAERSIAASDLAACDDLAVLNDLRGWRPASLI